MCGIAGALSLTQDIDSKLHLTAMTKAMEHRGPDSNGVYFNGNIGLGHRRLCIIDLSNAANQPYSDANKRYTIVFNGEIYNYRDIRAKLKQHHFETHSDTEVLLAAYKEWGARCLDYLKGMFVFAIWDEEEQRLFIARDRLGVKPLYYYADDKAFIFSSELRALLSHPKVPRSLNLQGVHRYLSFQSVGFPFSPVESIQQLEPGSFVVIDSLGIKASKYWSITKHGGKNLDFNDRPTVLRRVRELMYASVERRLISDVPIGAFLSGGIDSSVIVALMKEIQGGKPNTFSVGFHETQYDETHYAEEVARKFNTNHTKVMIHSTDFLDEIMNALNAIDSPSADGINTYVVSKKIRESGLVVALSGIGGDELFGGYPFFKYFHRINQNKIAWNRSFPLRHTASLFARNDKWRQLLASKNSSIHSLYPVFRQILSDRKIKTLIKFPPDFEAYDFILPKEIESFPSLSQVSIAEYLNYTQHTLLSDADQMSMAVSLELREPYFDHELIEYVLQVPDHIKYPNYPKQLLIDSLPGLLPSEIVLRKKQGFLFPWAVWLRNDLRSFCDKFLTNISQREFINGAELKKMWKQFLKGDPSVKWIDIWLFVVLEYWMEKNGIEDPGLK